MKVLMTAFGPFGDVKANPSEMVLEYVQRQEQADSCMVEWRVLPVAFDAVDRFVRKISSEKYDVIIHTGVAVGSLRPQIELNACNRVAGRDVHGVALDGVIEEDGPALLNSYLASHMHEGCKARHIAIEVSEDAGAYLCNYIYYKSLQRLGRHTGVAFIHLADFLRNPNASSLESQAGLLMKFLDIIR